MRAIKKTNYIYILILVSWDERAERERERERENRRVIEHAFAARTSWIFKRSLTKDTFNIMRQAKCMQKCYSCENSYMNIDLHETRKVVAIFSEYNGVPNSTTNFVKYQIIIAPLQKSYIIWGNVYSESLAYTYTNTHTYARIHTHIWWTKCRRLTSFCKSSLFRCDCALI